MNSMCFSKGVTLFLFKEDTNLTFLGIKMANNLVKIENEKRKVFLMAYGKQLPKDFIPEINSFAKSIGFIQLEVYPKIDKVEGDRDDSYAEFFK